MKNCKKQKKKIKTYKNEIFCSKKLKFRLKEPFGFRVDVEMDR